MEYSNNFNFIPSEEDVFDKIINERSIIGYYDLVNQDTTEVKEFANSIKQKDIVVVGIGGSSLGASAIYDFLKHTNEISKRLFFLESTDPVEMSAKLEKMNIKDALFIIISKSGTTIETISIFKYLHSIIDINSNNCIVVTESDSKLDIYAKKNKIKSFDIPKNVGGRFSVFSNVGLVPLAIVGVDIDKLLSGAREVYNQFFNDKLYKNELMKKAMFLSAHKDRFNINVVFSYSGKLESFNKWYVQLWGESLGKLDLNGSAQGLTPIGLVGPVDQHSFLQLIMEGKKDKTVTFIKVKEFKPKFIIPNITLDGLEELDYLNGINFAQLINMQADSTIKSISDIARIPFDVITLESICEECIAKLMYKYELLTSITGQYLKINTYDQPGVEAGKIILKSKLKGE
ncbi:MAG: glucose-6-phosphate isomerase [Epsilonproteobacteria bacterium]|nr:MAG: glucose-6-phosphate isomerase [Campylobacterota bacterium]